MNNKILNDYKKRIYKKCPICNQILSVVLHGLVQDKYLTQLKEDSIPFYNAGCCCYGDDRDEEFYCSSCKIKLDKKLKIISASNRAFILRLQSVLVVLVTDKNLDFPLEFFPMQIL